MRARRRKERSSRADESKDSGRIFRRGDTARLRVQRQGEAQEKNEAENHKCAFLHLVGGLHLQGTDTKLVLSILTLDMSGNLGAEHSNRQQGASMALDAGS
jgi:hypothetical protein